MRPDVLTVIILAVVVLLYATEKIPLVMTSILSMLAVYFTGILTFQDAFGGFCNNATMMVIGLTIFGIAFSETGITDILAQWLMAFFTQKGFSEKTFLLLSSVIIAALSMFVSPTMTVAIFMNIIDSLASQPGSKITRRNTTLPVSIAATFGANMTNISSTTVILSSGLLAESAFGRGFTFFEPLVIGGPALLVTLLFMGTVGYHLFTKVYTFDDSIVPLEATQSVKAPEKVISKRKCITVLVVLLICIALFIFSDLALGAVAFAGAAVLILTGCLSANTAFQGVNWSTVILVATSIGFAKGVAVSGAGLMIANFLIKLGGPLAASGFGICVIGLICSSLLSNFMSNSSTALILIPIFMVMAEQIGAPILPVVIAAGCGAGLASATPICTVNITMTTVVGYRFMHYVRTGGLINVLTIIACSIAIYLVYFI